MVKEISVDEVFTKVELCQGGPDIYSNFAKVTVTSNELILDFYKISPVPGKDEVFKMEHFQRIIMPVHVTGGLINALKSASGNATSKTEKVAAKEE